MESRERRNKKRKRLIDKQRERVLFVLKVSTSIRTEVELIGGKQ